MTDHEKAIRLRQAVEEMKSKTDSELSSVCFDAVLMLMNTLNMGLEKIKPVELDSCEMSLVITRKREEALVHLMERTGAMRNVAEASIDFWLSSNL